MRVAAADARVAGHPTCLGVPESGRWYAARGCVSGHALPSRFESPAVHTRPRHSARPVACAAGPPNPRRVALCDSAPCDNRQASCPKPRGRAGDRPRAGSSTAPGSKTRPSVAPPIAWIDRVVPLRSSACVEPQWRF
jgi:hypothetical protein